jgi:hypothetical protein
LAGAMARIPANCRERKTRGRSSGDRAAAF